MANFACSVFSGRTSARRFAVKSNSGLSAIRFRLGEPYSFAILRRDDVEIMLQRIDRREKPDLYRRVTGECGMPTDSVEGMRVLYESVREEASIVKIFRVQPYGNWEFEVRIRNGYVLVFSEPD